MASPRGLLVALLAAFVCIFLERARVRRGRESIIPPHMQSHPVVFRRNLLSNVTAEALRNLTKSMARFPTNVRDLDFYTTTHEHIGEAIPKNEAGICEHPFLVPASSDNNLCVLPGRIDIGKHFIMSGGNDGLRENYASMISRVQSFGRYNFDFEKYDVVRGLFREPEFLSMARKICPNDKTYLDPFQFNFIVQVPGQTVASHIDGAYFWGATRFQYPQWLLAAMVYSGMWKDRFVDQVQIVAYYHEWEPTDLSGGDFVFWNGTDSTSKHSIRPIPMAGSAVDGSKTIHAATVYRRSVQPPRLDKNRVNRLDYIGNETWILTASAGDDDERRYEYDTSDLRMSVVYRARCFATKKEADLYDGSGGPDILELENILEAFAEDLERRGELSHAEDAFSMPRLDFAMKIMEVYIKYPLPLEPWTPMNYCAAGRLSPILEFVLSPLCG